jgi:hypothetical protein
MFAISSGCDRVTAGSRPPSVDFRVQLIVVMAMTVTMVMIVIVFATVASIMIAFPISAPVGVAVAMVMSPVAFAIVPAARALFVMRGIPGGALVRWPHIVTGDPAIVILLWRPETCNPDKRGFRRRWRHLNANRRRRNPNVDRDLRPGRRREHCCNKPETHILFQHIFPSVPLEILNRSET